MVNYIFIKLKFVFKIIVLITSMYLYLFNPPFSFLAFGSIKLLYLFFLFGLVEGNELINFFKKFWSEIFLISLILAYSLFRDILYGEFVFFVTNFLMFLEGLVLPICIAYGFYKWFNEFNVTNIVIVASVIASLLSILLFLNPKINLFVKTELLQRNVWENRISNRAYGISEYLTYGYSIVQGIVFAIIVNFSIKQKYYIILLPFVFLSIMLSARIGYIPIIIIITYIILFRASLKQFVFLGLIFGFFYYFFFISGFFSDYSNIVNFSFDFFYQVQKFILGSSSQSSTFSTLFEKMFILPNNFIELIFGTGENIYLRSYQNSDVGFILQLYYGGFLYLLLLIFFIVFCTYRLFKIAIKDKWFIFLFVLVIILSNVKGYFINSNSGFRLLMLFYVFIILFYNSNFKLIGFPCKS